MTERMSFLLLITVEVKIIKTKKVKRAGMNLNHTSKIVRTDNLKKRDQPHQSTTLKMVPATNQIKIFKRNKPILLTNFNSRSKSLNKRRRLLSVK